MAGPMGLLDTQAPAAATPDAPSFFHRLWQNLQTPEGLQILGATMRQISTPSGDFISQANDRITQSKEQQRAREAQNAAQQAISSAQPGDRSGLFKALVGVVGPEQAAAIVRAMNPDPLRLGEGDRLVDPNDPSHVLAEGLPKNDAPTLKSYNDGQTEVTVQWDPKQQKFVPIARAPRYKANAAKSDPSVAVGPWSKY